MGLRPHLALIIGIDDFQGEQDSRFNAQQFHKLWAENATIPFPIGIEREPRIGIPTRTLSDFVIYDDEYGDPAIFALRHPSAEEIGGLSAEILLHALAEFLGCRVGAAPWHYTFSPVRWGEGGYMSRKEAEWQARHHGRFGGGVGLDRFYDLLDYPFGCENILQWVAHTLNWLGLQIDINELKVMLYFYWS